jgi:hypothetical protein
MKNTRHGLVGRVSAATVVVKLSDIFEAIDVKRGGKLDDDGNRGKDRGRGGR